MSLAAQLRSAGHRAFGEADGDASDFVAVAGIFELVGDAAGSERVLEAGLAVEPDSTVLLNNLGWARLARGEIGDRTVSLIERAVELKPDEHTSLDTLGWLRYAQGRFSDGPDGPGAVTLISRAIERSPGAAGAEVHDHLGDARMQQRPGAHQAGLEGREQARAHQARDPQAPGRLAQHQDLGVCAGIDRLACAVVIRGQGLPSDQEHRPHGHLVEGQGLARLGQGQPHPGTLFWAEVRCGGGRRGLSGHGYDPLQRRQRLGRG